MVVAIDPETGTLGLPSPGQMSAIQARRAEAFRLSPDGLVEIRRPDGAVGLVLGSRSQSYSLARTGPDGHSEYRCVSGGTDSVVFADRPPAREDR